MTMYKNKNNARAGEAWSINNKRIRGHIGRIAKRKKDTAYVVVTTHSAKTHKRKNLPLKNNLNKKDSRDAYVLKKAEKVKIKNLGKFHPDMIVNNSVDKSIFRHIGKRRK